jgi:hypothetical protein
MRSSTSSWATSSGRAGACGRCPQEMRVQPALVPRRDGLAA